MRALVITHVYPRWTGDSQAPFLAHWAKALRHAGHDLRILAPHDRGAELDETLDGIPIHRVRYGDDEHERVAYRGQMHELVKSRSGMAQLGRLTSAMVHAIRQEVHAFKPDIVHVHWWVPGMIWARLAAVRVPIVCQLHGTDVKLAQRNGATRRLARWALARADGVEAVSTHLASQAAALTATPIRINPMPLGEGFFSPPTAPSTIDLDLARVLGVGRLVPAKGWRELIEACANSPVPLLVRIIGSGPQHDELLALAHHLQVPLELPGNVNPEQMPNEYRQADVVVHPSHAEGFGMVIPEALACRRPIVATNSGGVLDLLEPEHVVPVGDVLALRAAILNALNDPQTEQAENLAERVHDLLSPQAAAERSTAIWHAVAMPSYR
ncbi:glycosyltransferase [Stomatohabitans albus]|uniref:glycosyltransferase n=1 Tax=Stomatohabitans albus TaxID=3110766 RepID=UPI00300C402F